MHHTAPSPAESLLSQATPAQPMSPVATLAKPILASVPVHLRDTVLTRILWLYGAQALLANLCYLVGYYVLPEGFLRSSPWLAVGGRVAEQGEFWAQLGLTLLINGGYMGIGVALNLMVVRGIPQGYLIPPAMGLFGGLVAGTNSFAASDLNVYTARDGQALALSIGGLEMLAYVLVVAATTKLGVWEYRSWYDLHEKATKVMPLRTVRLSRGELGCILLAFTLLLLGAYRETLMAFGQL